MGPEVSSLQAFREGAALLPRAFALLRTRRELWAPAALPAALTILGIAVAGALVVGNAAELFSLIRQALPDFEAGAWYSWLWVGPARALVAFASLVSFALVAAFAALIGLVLATLLASPFLDLLSQRVERVIRGIASGDDEHFDAATIARDALSSFLNEARRVGAFAVVWLAITLVGLTIPLAAPLVPLALVAVAVVFLPLEYAGLALDRRRVSFASRRAWLSAHRSRALGFGAAGLAIGLVPGLNFLLLPVLIAAGTLLVIEHPPQA